MKKKFKNTLKKHVVNELDILGSIAVFVGLFAGMYNFSHAIPEQLIEVNKLPSPQTYAEFVLICYMLTKLNVPVAIWGNMKQYSKKIYVAITEIN
ncbi:MAG: hypothetical protein ACP5N1_03155 [Candidatus Woesearchaeota archaeon]